MVVYVRMTTVAFTTFEPRHLFVSCVHVPPTSIAGEGVGILVLNVSHMWMGGIFVDETTGRVEREGATDALLPICSVSVSF